MHAPVINHGRGAPQLCCGKAS